MNSLPDLRLLATFVAVARTGSMASAATTLDYVPSAVSQHVAALEKILGGGKLFNRKSGQNVSITAAGRTLLEAAEELFAASVSFQDIARQVSIGEGLDLRIGAYGTALSYLLPGALATLRQHHRSSIGAVEVEAADGLPLLERGELDILIAARYRKSDPPSPTDKLAIHTIGREQLVLVTSRGNDPLPLKRCLAGDWVAGQAKDIDRKHLTQWAHEAGFEPRVQYESADYHTAIELIAAGSAIGFIPMSALVAEHNMNRLTPVSLPDHIEAPARTVLAITRPHYAATTIDILLGAARNELAAHPEEK